MKDRIIDILQRYPKLNNENYLDYLVAEYWKQYDSVEFPLTFDAFQKVTSYEKIAQTYREIKRDMDSKVDVVTKLVEDFGGKATDTKIIINKDGTTHNKTYKKRTNRKNK